MHLCRSWIALGVFALLAGGPAVQAATVYKWTDADGVVHYSDQPEPGAEKIVTSTGSSHGSRDAGERGFGRAPAAKPKAPAAPSFSQFAIVSPANEQTFTNQPVSVHLALEPGLKPQQAISWSLNGTALSEPPDATQFTLEDLPRGTYSIAATVTDQGSGESKSADPVTFYVVRASLLSPTRKGGAPKSPLDSAAGRASLAAELRMQAPAHRGHGAAGCPGHQRFPAGSRLAGELPQCRRSRSAGLGTQSSTGPAHHRAHPGRGDAPAPVRARPAGRRGRGAARTGLAGARRRRPNPRLRGHRRHHGPGSGRLLLEIEDITQHRRLTRENALLAQLGGSRLMVRQLAHEIKNPLGGLRGAAQLLERELLDPALREYTRIIISEADRLTHLLDSMLGPGRPPAKQLVNVHELLERVYHLLRSEAPDGVTVERDYDPSLPPLTVDPNHIIQAMLNLGRNAIQALAAAASVASSGAANGAARPDFAHPRRHQCQHRRAPPPSGRHHSIRGQRSGGARGNSRHDFLPARVGARRRHRPWVGTRPGSGEPARRPHRVRQRAR